MPFGANDTNSAAVRRHRALRSLLEFVTFAASVAAIDSTATDDSLLIRLL
jgi:hypothetical protein